jgi:hypothetical protein
LPRGLLLFASSNFDLAAAAGFSRIGRAGS